MVYIGNNKNVQYRSFYKGSFYRTFLIPLIKRSLEHSIANFNWFFSKIFSGTKEISRPIIKTRNLSILNIELVYLIRKTLLNLLKLTIFSLSIKPS